MSSPNTNMAIAIPLESSIEESLIPSTEGVEVNDVSSTRDNDLRSSTAPSTPALSADEIGSNDGMDLVSDSELSSLHTTPECSPRMQSTIPNDDVNSLLIDSPLVKPNDTVLKTFFTENPPMEVSHVTSSASLVRGKSSLILKLVFTNTSRLESILSSAPRKPALQNSTASVPKPAVQSPEGGLDRISSSIPTPAVQSSKGSSLENISSSQSTPVVQSSEENLDRISSSTTAKQPEAGIKKRKKRDSEDADFDEVKNEDVESENADELTAPPKKRARKTTPAQPKTARKPRQQRNNNSSSLANATRLKAGPAKKYWKSEQEGLPAPFGNPPAWANTRQALCETMSYYRAYQSGVYTNQGRAYGLLIDKEGSNRDVFNEEIVITRVGGGKQFDKAKGRMVQTADTDSSATRRAFERNRDEQKPVAIIAGQGNSRSPSKMPHYYNVLAWFHVTDVWTERNATGMMDAMVRLEKINLCEKSWWAAAGTPLPDRNRDMDAVTTPYGSCVTCQKTSQEIFQQGWTCLHTACPRYFEFDIPASVPALVFYDGLAYSREFVEKRTHYQGLVEDLLVPSLPTSDNIGTKSFGCESEFGKGVVCPKCSACIRRTKWMGWSCENPDCNWSLSATRATASVAQAIGDSKPKNTLVDPLIRTWDMVLGSYDVTEYIIPGEEPGTQAGFVRHFQASDTINSQPNGPNDLFREMQSEDLYLERKPVRTPGSTGEILTNHYLMNWGAPYKFIAPVDSKPFSEAPIQILKALMRMTWAGNQAVSANQGQFVPFNELLSLGYSEGGAMSYHDDGESTLGPTVCSFSLGASSTMSWRPKKKAKIGTAGKSGNKPAMLSITLKHGDMMVMHGADIQKLYEHAVEPHGKLRFVFTGRHIVSAQIPDPADRARALIDGALPANINQYTYDGDVNPIPLSVLETAESKLKAENALLADLEALVLGDKLSEHAIAKLQELSALTLSSKSEVMPQQVIGQSTSGSSSSN